MLIFTLCSNNYLPYAFSLGNSIRETNSNCEFIIGLVDNYNVEINYEGFNILDIKNVVLPDILLHMSKQYNVVELNTAVKPYFFEYFFNLGNDKIIYLDPDIIVYNSFDNLSLMLNEFDVIVTPHINSPLPSDGKYPDERGYFGTGVYNLGFVAFHFSKQTTNYIDWWKLKLLDGAFSGKGYFYDQLWMVFVNCFMDKVKVLRNPGYNICNWNLHERYITKHNNIYYVNDIHELVFFHYSNFNINNTSILATYNNRYTINNRPDIAALYQNFINRVQGYDYFKYSNIIPNYGISKDHEKSISDLNHFSIILIKLLNKMIFFIKKLNN